MPDAASGATPSAEATVRVARREDMADVVAAMARALADDPFVAWLVGGRPGADARRAVYVDLMVRRVSLALEGVTTDDARRGAAAWIPPGGQPLPLGMRLAILPAMARFVGLTRLGEVGAATAIIEAERPRTAHWHLALLGVAPEHQRRGLGLALLAPTLALCDRARLPAHAETSNPHNLAFYGRAGFRILRDLPPDPTGRPRMWILQRSPT